MKNAVWVDDSVADAVVTVAKDQRIVQSASHRSVRMRWHVMGAVFQVGCTVFWTLIIGAFVCFRL